MSVTENLPSRPDPGAEVAAQVRAFVLSNFYVTEPDAFGNGDSLLARGVVDSTGFLQIIGFLEATFGIAIDDRELVPDNFDSVEKIAAFATRKLAAAK